MFRCPSRPALPLHCLGFCLPGLTAKAIAHLEEHEGCEELIDLLSARSIEDLERLGVGTNLLSGSIPRGLSGLTRLTRLGLDRNAFI